VRWYRVAQEHREQLEACAATLERAAASAAAEHDEVGRGPSRTLLPQHPASSAQLALCRRMFAVAGLGEALRVGAVRWADLPLAGGGALRSHGRGLGAGAAGGSFLRVHWVAVPEALRARRVNRRCRRRTRTSASAGPAPPRRPRSSTRRRWPRCAPSTRTRGACGDDARCPSAHQGVGWGGRGAACTDGAGRIADRTWRGTARRSWQERTRR
jgi:hypothetical protein